MQVTKLESNTCAGDDMTILSGKCDGTCFSFFLIGNICI